MSLMSFSGSSALSSMELMLDATISLNRVKIPIFVSLSFMISTQMLALI
jgi:hypothetical protein